jgi:hypothetical protein
MIRVESGARESNDGGFGIVVLYAVAAGGVGIDAR